MERELSAAYADLHRRHWWFRGRERVVLGTLRRYLPARERGAVLDVGCGDGLFFDRLAEFGEVEGVEPDTAVIGDRFRGRIHAVPFDERFRPGKQYSLVLMLDVLEHLAYAPAALRHALGLLAPGGLLVVTLPAFQLLWTAHDDLNHHVRRYTKASFHAMANGAPMEILEERYLFQALFPAKLAARAVGKLFGLPPRVPSVPPRPVNEILCRWLLAEEALFRKISPPFGSSLLVVARR